MAAKRKMNQKIEFKKRAATGTGVCRKIRAKNATPVVLYGPEFKEGLAGTVITKDILPIANSGYRETTVVELVMDDGKTCQALIRDVQRHPLSRQLRHIDFYEVVKGHKIKVEVPVRVINRELAPGIKDDGGILDFPTRVITIDVEPSLIPEEIVYDAKDLAMGSEVFVKDLALPEGASCVTEPDTLLLHIVAPKVEVEAPVEAVAEGAEEAPEVEVVAKGKASKEGAEEEEDTKDAKGGKGGKEKESK